MMKIKDLIILVNRKTYEKQLIDFPRFRLQNHWIEICYIFL